MDVTLRLGAPDDLPALCELLKDGGLYNDKLDYSDFTLPVVVADLGGQIVGFVQALLGRPYTVVTEIAIHKAFRSQGVGRRLMDAVTLIAGEYGSSAVFAAAHVDNADSNAKVAHSWGEFMCEAKFYVRYI